MPDDIIRAPGATAMLWVKAFHIIFMVTWFAGLFYLPRLFVYHVQASDELSKQRFEVMERKLFAIMTIGAVLTTAFGIWLLVNYAWTAYGESRWLLAKLALVVGLFGFHAYCLSVMRDLRQGTSRHSHVFYRWLNEIPVLFLISIVILAVVKPG